MSYPPPPPPPGSAGAFEPRPGQYPPPGPYPQPAGYPPQQAVVQSLPRLRGRTLLRLAIIFLVVGLAAMIGGGVLLEGKALSKVKNFERVALNGGEGTGTVHLTKGKVVVYYEAPGADSLRNDIPLAGITLQSPSGQRINVQDLYGGGKLSASGSNKIKTNLTYSTDGHDGIAILQFNAPESGQYQVAIQSQVAKDNSDYAFGPDINTAQTIAVIIILLGVLLFITGIILLIIGLVKRHNHKKEIKQHGYVVALQPGPPPPPQNPGSMYDQQFQRPQ